MMPDTRRRKDMFFTEVPDSLRKEVLKRLERMDEPRAGGIWPSTFEDGMRFVYLQLLATSSHEASMRLKEIIEGYSQLRGNDFDRERIIYEFRKKYMDARVEELRKSKQEAKTDAQKS